jgi:ABC-type methionine transport system permease subunit
MLRSAADCAVGGGGIGRLAWRGLTRGEREIMVWFLPRALITAVPELRLAKSDLPAL